jgi:hypothetical protein
MVPGIDSAIGAPSRARRLLIEGQKVAGIHLAAPIVTKRIRAKELP